MGKRGDRLLIAGGGRGIMTGMKRNAVKNDILLILALLLLSAALWGLLRLTKKQGGEAVVSVDGAVVAVLPLSADATVTVGEDRGFRNTVEVADSRVRVTDADCPDRLCVRQGWISREGESIVCLPHKLTVTVRGGTQGVDALAR